MASPKKKGGHGGRLVAENRRARFDYFIEEKLEAGIMLEGSEVKSLRDGQANITEAYAEVKDGEMFLINASIPRYGQASYNNHDERRPRKLLLHKKEINRLGGLIQRAGVTVVPLQLYFNERGRAKVELGLAKGKKQHDKRETQKTRDWNRQKARLMREHG